MVKNKITLKLINLDNYNITGFYYKEGKYLFRKYLNIRAKNYKGSFPDLMVIMMNPGSSEPTNGDDNGRIETEAKPDLTQNQIIRAMEDSNFKYARVLNLSDLREPKSSQFYRKINPMSADGIYHSIFGENRNQDFSDLYVKGIPVIYAWGVNKKLMSLAKRALETTRTENSIGWNKPRYDFAYYHPLPRSYKKQREWSETIEEKIKTHESNSK